MARLSQPIHGLLFSLALTLGLSACKESPVPEVPVIPKDPVVVDSGKFTDANGVSHIVDVNATGSGLF